MIRSDGSIKGTKKGQLVAYISGLRKDNGRQAIWAVAYEDQRKTFTQPLNQAQPLLDAVSQGASSNKTDERDPDVFTWQGTY